MRFLFALGLLLVISGPAFADFSACNAALRTKDLDQKIVHYTTCIEKGNLQKTDRAGALNNRGVAYMQKGELDKALADFSQSIALDPRWGTAHINRARIYFEQGKLDLAKADLDKAVRLDPARQRPEAYAIRAGIHQIRGEYADAIDDYDQAIKGDRKLVLAYNGKAWILATCPDAQFREGKEAVKLAKKAISLEDNWRIHDTLAAAYAESGQFDDAVREEQTAINSASGGSATMAALRARLSLYQNQQPYRDQPPNNAGLTH